MRTTSKIAAVLVAASTAVLPIAAATSASAATSSGCTVTPLKPIFAGFNSSGVKLVNYRITVSCSSNRTVSITQKRYEEDGWPNPDDYLGTTSFSTSGVRTLNNVRTLVNTESGYEEVYQKVQFRVTSGGVTSPWTSWQKSSVLSILD